VIRRVRPARVARVVFAASLFGLALVAAVGGGSSSAAGDPVAIQGAGSWAPAAMITDWGNDLYGPTDSPKINLNYTAHGTLLGRQDLLSGNVDFAITGVPFTADELSAANKAEGDYISAPIQVASLAWIISPPPTGFVIVTFACNPDDPAVVDPGACFVFTPYNDPAKALGTSDNPYLKIPNLNLAAMSSSTSGNPLEPLNIWENPDVRTAAGIPDPLPPPNDWNAPDWQNIGGAARPYSVLRSDGDETSYYVQQFWKAVSKNVSPATDDIWAAVVHAVSPTADPSTYPITERLPRIGQTQTRDGAEQQVKQLGLGGADPASGTISDQIKGVLAPAPASAISYAKGSFPKQFFETIAMKNGAGEWVAPTTETLTKAAQASADHDDQALFALGNDVSGAYPLAWIDRIYVPAHGLTVDKTEAIATSIRYIVTDGQAAEAKAGEGKLADSQVAAALDAANKIVQSNCVGADETIVKSSDPGRLAPDLPGMKSIGDMLHCNPLVAPSTTAPATSPRSTLSTSAVNPASVSQSTLPTLTPPASAAAQSTATANDAVKSRKTATGALAASNLPLDRPGSDDTADDVATFLLGAGLYLVLRGPAVRLYARVAR